MFVYLKSLNFDFNCMDEGINTPTRYPVFEFFFRTVSSKKDTDKLRYEYQKDSGKNSTYFYTRQKLVLH